MSRKITFILLFILLFCFDILGANTTLMTFNIRRDIGDRVECEEDWKTVRFKKFKNIMKFYNPDVVCLQEVQNKDINSQYYDVICFMASKGYLKFIGNEMSNSENLPIFWKKDKFMRMNYDNWSYNIGSNLFKNRGFNCVELKCIDKNNKQYGKYFLIGNTHWKSGKIWAMHREDSASDMINILQEINKIINNDISITLIAGDFNCERNSGEYLVLKSQLSETGNYPCTSVGFCNNFCFKAIDFIFYKGIENPSYAVGTQTGTSDHLPVMISF